MLVLQTGADASVQIMTPVLLALWCGVQWLVWARLREEVRGASEGCAGIEEYLMSVREGEGRGV